MIVLVDETSVTTEEADDVTRLKVLSSLATAAVIERLVDDGLAATPRGEEADRTAHVWLDVAVLRARALAAPGTRVRGWTEAWDDMITFAREHGWVRGTHLRAHIETDHEHIDGA